MKIRTSFVTNSSSSSFVLAMKKDITMDQVKRVIRMNKDHAIGFAQDNSDPDYGEFNDLFDGYRIALTEEQEEEGAFRLDGDRLFEEKLLDEMSNWFFRKIGDGMDLDSWHVVGGEISNDSGDFTSMFLYDVGMKFDPNLLRLQFMD